MWGGGGGGRKKNRGLNGFQGEQTGGTDWGSAFAIKGGDCCKLTANKGGSLEYYRVLGMDQVKTSPSSRRLILISVKRGNYEGAD